MNSSYVNREGYELNPWLVYYSKFASVREGVSSTTSFEVKGELFLRRTRLLSGQGID